MHDFHAVIAQSPQALYENRTEPYKARMIFVPTLYDRFSNISTENRNFVARLSHGLLAMPAQGSYNAHTIYLRAYDYSMVI